MKKESEISAIPHASPTAVSPENRARFWIAARVLLALLGLAAVVAIVLEVGVEQLTDVLVPALPWLPLATALEVLRIGMDGVSTRQTLGTRGKVVPWLPLFASHLVAYSVMAVAPAGRATAEAVKASLLSRWTGGATAAAMGTANQANVLLSSGTFTLLSAWAAYVVTGWSILTWVLLAHFASMNVFGLALRAAARYERLGAWLGRRFPRLGRHAAAFHSASRETPLYPVKPVGAMILGRVFQAGHFGVVAAAVGITPSVAGALAVHGVYLVVAAVAVMIPGQLGASELGFQMSAEILHTTETRAVAIALLSHAVQITLTVAGFVVLLFWRGPGAAREALDPSQIDERASRPPSLD